VLATAFEEKIPYGVYGVCVPTEGTEVENIGVVVTRATSTGNPVTGITVLLAEVLGSGTFFLAGCSVTSDGLGGCFRFPRANNIL